MMLNFESPDYPLLLLRDVTILAPLFHLFVTDYCCLYSISNRRAHIVNQSVGDKPVDVIVVLVTFFVIVIVIIIVIEKTRHLVFEKLDEAVLQPVDVGLSGAGELHVLVHPKYQELRSSGSYYYC